MPTLFRSFRQRMFDFTGSRFRPAVAAFFLRRGAKLLTYVAAAMLALLAARTAAAVDFPARVDISVVDDKNQPVAEVSIAVSGDNKDVPTIVTDASGEASVLLPARGTYLLTIAKKGYLSAQATVDATKSSEPPPVDVVLNSVDLNQQSVDVKGTAWKQAPWISASVW